MSESHLQTLEYRRRICRAIDFLNQRLSENPSVEEIARAAPFSRFHFQRLFKAIVGESVAEFTRRLRLEMAARRMLHGSAGSDITGLAMDLGFSSSQNFAKAFKKHFGVSPSAFNATESRIAEASWDGVGTAISGVPFRDPPSFVGVVQVRQLASMRVAYRRHFGSYDDPEVQAAFDDLQRWAQARDVDNEHGYLGIPWDDAEITPDDKCRFDACVIIGEGKWVGTGVNIQEIPSGKYATFRSQINHHDFELPWTLLMQSWLPSSGFEPADGPRFELYHSDGTTDPDGGWDIEICLPIHPV